MKILALIAIAIGVFLLRTAYLTYQQDPDALTAPTKQKADLNDEAAVNPHFQEEHQLRTMMEIEGLGGGVFVLGGIVLFTVRR